MEMESGMLPEWSWKSCRLSPETEQDGEQLYISGIIVKVHQCLESLKFCSCLSKNGGCFLLNFEFHKSSKLS